MKFLIFLFFSLILTTKINPQELIQNLGSLSRDDIFEILSFGDMNGYLTTDQVNQITGNATLQYPQFAKPPVKFGETYLNRPMYQYTISYNNDYVNKSVVYLSALHHAREVVSLATLMATYLLTLQNCILNKTDTLKITDYMFVPFVNLDSYEYIQDHYKKSHNVLEIRKNRHKINNKCSEVNMGVDLNRNYDYKFGDVPGGSSEDPCAEDYNGEYAFSEPEIFSIKTLIENTPNLKLAINMHAYGNLWIIPYNSEQGSNNQIKKNKTAYFFYKKFEKEANLTKDSKVGNAFKTINYFAAGESSDWLTGVMKILSISPEIGSFQGFFPSRELIPDLIREAVPGFEYLFNQMDANIIEIQSKNTTFRLFNNQGISGLNYLTIELDNINEYTKVQCSVITEEIKSQVYQIPANRWYEFIATRNLTFSPLLQQGNGYICPQPMDGMDFIVLTSQKPIRQVSIYSQSQLLLTTKRILVQQFQNSIVSYLLMFFSILLVVIFLTLIIKGYRQKQRENKLKNQQLPQSPNDSKYDIEVI